MLFAIETLNVSHSKNNVISDVINWFVFNQFLSHTTLKNHPSLRNFMPLIKNNINKAQY